MAMKPTDTRPAQSPDVPAEVEPNSLETGELGSEGGSYAELVQSLRSRDRGGEDVVSPAAARGNPLLWIAIAVVVVTILLWFAAGRPGSRVRDVKPDAGVGFSDVRLPV
jgi:hypothetical protein